MPRGQGPPGDRACPAAWQDGEASEKAGGARRGGGLEGPKRPACGRWDRAHGVLRPQMVASGLPAAVPPWLSLVSGNQDLEQGQWGSPSVSCTASGLQFMDSLKVCKTLCQHQSVCKSSRLFVYLSQPTSLFYPLEAEMGTRRLCGASLRSCPTSSQSLNT